MVNNVWRFTSRGLSITCTLPLYSTSVAKEGLGLGLEATAPVTSKGLELGLEATTLVVPTLSACDGH